MSNGYTSALATAAPVAPAMAEPHGGSIASFDCTAISRQGLVYYVGTTCRLKCVARACWTMTEPALEAEW